MSRRDYFAAPVQTLLGFARADAAARRAAHLGGDDPTDLGRVLWNG